MYMCMGLLFSLIDSWQVPYIHVIVIKTFSRSMATRHKVWIEDYDFIAVHVHRDTYIFKGGSRRGLKSGMKIIYDKTSRIKESIVE
jgi:hypothetical protein